MPLTNGARNGAGGHAEAIVRTYLHRLLVQRDLSVCEEMLAANYVDHDAPAGTPPGPGPTREYVTQLLHAYPDLQFTIVTMTAQDRSVAVRATWRGTHRDTSTSRGGSRSAGRRTTTRWTRRPREPGRTYHWYADPHGQAHKADNSHP
jgi:hypothetical protein